MALDEREAFWNDFLRQDKTQKALKLQQKALIQQSAILLQEKYEEEAKGIVQALSGCSEKTRELISPIIENPVAHRLLRTVLNDSRKNETNFEDEMNRNKDAYSRIEQLHNEYTMDPQEFNRAGRFWNTYYRRAKEALEDETFGVKKINSWKDMPEEELTDRLSKGEIIPRDEWIPGISKEKRLLDPVTMKSHLNLGTRMREEGNEAYNRESFDTAFIRFSQGVQLLNWIRTDDPELQEEVNRMYLGFLRNLAQAALKLEKYQETIRACTTIIQDIDAHDTKARYRRGMAYTMLGMLESAKDDYMFILKSPYSEEFGVKAARSRLKDLKKIFEDDKKHTQEVITRSVQQDLFSANRIENIKNVSGNLPNELPEDLTKTMQVAPKERKNWFADRPLMSDIRRNIIETEEKEEHPYLTLENTQAVLEELLEAYTDKEIEKELNELRLAADFEPKRLLIRVRKFLPQIQKPIFDKFELCDPIHKINLRKVESSIRFWRKTNNEIEELRKDCWYAVFGDVIDLDFE